MITYMITNDNNDNLNDNNENLNDNNDNIYDNLNDNNDNLNTVLVLVSRRCWCHVGAGVTSVLVSHRLMIT